MNNNMESKIMNDPAVEIKKSLHDGFHEVFYRGGRIGICCKTVISGCAPYTATSFGMMKLFEFNTFPEAVEWVVEVAKHA